MHHVVLRVLLDSKQGIEASLTTSPYCAGIITGTMVWLAWSLLTRIVSSAFSQPPNKYVSHLTSSSLDTPGHAYANLLFALLYILCSYNFFRSITLDAGACPAPIGEEEKKLVRPPSAFFFLMEL